MEPTTSKVKDVTESTDNNTPVKDDSDDNVPKNSILDSFVTSVKRKLNQSLSPNSQKQEETGDTERGSKVTALKRSCSRPDLDSSLMIEDYDTEDDRPLATISKKRTRALVKAKRFRKTLQRQGTPLKTMKPQQQPLKTSKPQQQQQHQPHEVEKGVAEANKDHIPNAQAMEMLEKLQKDITEMKLDTAANKIEIQQINKTAELMVSKVVTQEQLEETIKKYTGPIQKTLETQSVEIKRHTVEIGKIEENLGTIQVSLTSHESGLEERKRKDTELEHDIGIVRAEAISRVDELQRQVKDIQEQMAVKNVIENNPTSQMTYAQAAATPPDSDVCERAIIIEGVHEHREEQLDDIMFRMADEMRLPVYDWEINRVERIGSWRPDRRWPRPIKVEFTTVRKRDMFIANRIALEQTENFFRVRIRADEPLQARQLKSKLRRAVYTARKDGMRARFLSDEEILIEGKKYNKGNIDTHLEKQNGEKRNGMPLSNQNKDREFGGNCIRTPQGLAFFGYRSILSSFYRCPIMREGKRHETLEHGYQGDKALDMKDAARYSRIREAKTASVAKSIGGEIPNTERWNIQKRPIMRGWLFHKFRQHPELADFLISTKGHHLKEASPHDSWWGAGVGLESRELMDGSWDGHNVLGEELEYVREVLIEERKPWQERLPGLVPQIPPPDHLAAPTRAEQAPERQPADTRGEHQPMDITPKTHSTRL